jgi:riboflavin synthase
LRDAEFDVMIIPFTWEHTNLHARATRDRVNLECDMVGKYVARAAQAHVGAGFSRLDKK